jgi:hypothetical protein
VPSRRALPRFYPGESPPSDRLTRSSFNVLLTELFVRKYHLARAAPPVSDGAHQGPARLQGGAPPPPAASRRRLARRAADQDAVEAEMNEPSAPCSASASIPLRRRVLLSIAPRTCSMERDEKAVCGEFDG